MNLARYAARSLRHYRRAHLPVVLGVAVATAVLTGALVVGDSVRGSLRDLTLQRLGRIDQALVTQQPFRAALADELAAAEGFGRAFAGADAAFLLRGSLSSSGAGRRYAGGVQVVGVSPRFKQHGDAVWVDALAPDTVAITAPLAEELGVSEGGEVVLRLPTVTALPADSPLGEKADTTIGKRLTIARVLPPTGLARFSLAPSQTDPRNAFLPLATVQLLLGEPGGANALLVDGLAASRPSTPEDADGLAESLRPTLADYGLSVEALAGGRVQVESNALVLPEAVVEAADSLGGRRIQPVTTYLANTLRVGDQQVVYSTVSGVDSTAAGGPLLDDSGRPVNLSDDEIALNDGAAERLGAVVGDTVTVNYYEPESTHGELVTASPLRLKLRAIFPLASAGGAPTCAADPRLTPTLQGVTDADSINDWDLPFELVEPITQDDEDYWDAHAATPKAFVSFALARRLWATRWGSVSLLRFEGETPRRVGAELREAINPAEVGFAFQPVKRQGLAAAGGSTPFDALFFGFSMFLIASAVMLIALLFGLGIENRAREVGLLSAVGWSAPRVRSALVGEGLRVAAAGVVLGVPVGVLYAGLMIWGLTTLWVEAIVTPFLSLHARWQSLAVGGVVGLAVAWATISLVVRRLVRRPPRALLAGLTTGIATRASRGKRLTGVVAVALAGAAVGLPIAGNASGAQADVRAGYFFGGGAALLASLLLGVHGLLSRVTIRHAAPSPFRLASLAWRNVARNRGRSLLTLALVGAASFLLLAISAFRLDPSEEGTGGYALVGQSDQPVHFDLNTDQGRLELGLGGRDEEQLDGYTVRALRVHDGEDASCLNLYQTRQPRVLGVPDDVIKRGGFSFAASAHGIENPWSALTAPAQPSTSSPRPPAPGTQPPAPGP
ncbi:MAG: FtsX-like permease family protein, partial [Planctomycetota bacterium]